VNWNVILPVVTLILGALLTQLGEARREAAALKRERKLRELDRDQARLDRRESFELSHLIDVHEGLSEVFTAALRVHEHVEGQTAIPPEVNDNFMAANRKIASIKGLVLDDEIRLRVDSAHGAANRMSMGAGSIERTFALLDQAQMGIAARIREIYGPDSNRELRP
jgi:hypothetical protein